MNPDIKHFVNTRKLSFKYAFAGLWHMLRTQKNTWIHLLATVCTIVMAAWLALPLGEWATLILTIGMVWFAEAFNTALEACVDLCSPEWHILAKVAKDASAAAVLIAAITSVVIGILILGPPLWGRIVLWFFPG